MRSPRTTPSSSIEPTAVVLLAIAAGVALYLATATWPDTPDGWIHLHRTRALADALRWGVLFPRVFPDFGFGYAYPVLNFYAPASYYPPALLTLLGIDLLLAVRLALAAGFALSTVGAYALARLWSGPAAALVAALLFLLFPYRLYDLFVRGALPEFAAFLWLPWLCWATVRLVRVAAKSSEPPAPAALPVALLWAALLLTHNLTAMLVAFAALGIAALLLGLSLVRNEVQSGLRALAWVIIAYLVGSLLATWYVIPALAEARWVGIGNEAGDGYREHFAGLSTLFTWRVPYVYPAAADPQVPLPGIVALLAPALLLLLLRPQMAARRIAGLLAISLLLAIWLTTEASAPVWSLLRPLLGRLQFPWRWQSLLALASALAVALLLDSLWARWRIGARFVAAAAVSAALLYLLVGGLRWTALPDASQPWDVARMWQSDATFGQVGASWTGEFLPRWVTEQRWAIGREPPEAPQPRPPVAARARLTSATLLAAEYEVAAPAAWTAALHRFHYPAWQISLDGNVQETRPSGVLGLVSTDVPAGESRLRLAWGATPAVWAGRAATLLGFLGSAWLVLRLRRRAAWVALWLGVGSLALLGATGITARALPVQPLSADFGPVHLAGAVTPLLEAGSQGEVTLHWLVNEDRPNLTVFLHLLDGQGQIVTQHDGALGGAYTPAGRLHPGQIVDIAYPLSIPAQTPPGAYTLRVGLYAPGAPEAPLPVKGSTTPFVEGIGVEVRP